MKPAIMKSIVICLLVFLTACGGGDWEDEPTDQVQTQADGNKTIQPVNCAASGVCT